jgi:tight adherence protein C
MKYGIYVGILGGYSILFLLGRGGFRKAADYLRKRSRTIGLLVSTETLSVILVIFLVSDVLALAVTRQSEEQNSATKDFLYREDYGGTALKKTVTLKKDGKEQQVEIELEPRKLTQKEIDKALISAMQELPSVVLGDQAADHVTKDLKLPETIGSPAVSLEWITDNPDVISWDGSLGSHLSPKGTEAMLTCELSLEDTVRETALKVMVFPKKKTKKEKLEEQVNQEVAKENAQTERKVRLPEYVSGEKAEWIQEEKNDGIRILALGLLLAGVAVLLSRKEKEDEQAKRTEGLKNDYPKIVSRFVLFMNAGISVRRSLEKIASEYRNIAERNSAAEQKRCVLLRKKRRMHPGFEEICHVMEDLQKGVPEMRAYSELGKRCRTAEYKNFSDLLIRCVTKGGRDILMLMQKEAAEAEEMRRKQVRMRGEEAGTKMLLPMVLMLAVVMAILMIPAMLNFGI